MPSDDLKARFTEKVDKSKGKWRWTAAVNSDGYPKMKDDGKLRLASHVSLELAGRKAPSKGKVVLHKNNDPQDVNPANLSVSTQQANLKQMRDQGRDRPRGVDQEPDVPREKRAFACFFQEMRRIFTAKR